MNMKVHIYKEGQIDAAIAKVAKDASSLRTKIHNVAVSIAKVWHDEGFKVRKDAEKVQEVALAAAKRFTALQNASPYHANAFSQWVALMTSFEWSAEAEVWYPMPGDENPHLLMGKQFQTMRNTPFWEVSPPPAAKPLTNEVIIKTLQGILDKQLRHKKKAVEGDNFSDAGNEHIREAIKALS